MKNLSSLVLLTTIALTSSFASADVERSMVRRSDLGNSSGSFSRDYHHFIGVQGSLGIAHASVSLPQGFESNTSSRLRFMTGAFYEYRFIPYIGARAEFDFHQRGFSTPLQGDGSRNFSVNYLEFPLSARAQIPTRYVTPFLLTGPFLGIAVSKFRYDSGNGQSTTDVDISDDVNTVNFGFNFGAGIDFHVIEHFNIELMARYSLSVLNALANPQTDNAIRLNDVQFISGVSFSI